jgi:hypothetical protein
MEESTYMPSTGVLPVFLPGTFYSTGLRGCSPSVIVLFAYETG